MDLMQTVNVLIVGTVLFHFLWMSLVHNFGLFIDESCTLPSIRTKLKKGNLIFSVENKV